MDRKFAELAQRLECDSRPGAARSADFALIRPGARHAGSPAQSTRRFAGQRPRCGLSPLPRTRNWARSAGRLGLFYGPRENEIAHNLCTAVIDPTGKLARLEVGTERNKWETVDLLKTIYSLIPPSGQGEKSVNRRSLADLRARLAANPVSANL